MKQIKENWLFILLAITSVWFLFKAKTGVQGALNALDGTNDGQDKTTDTVTKALNSQAAVKKALTVKVHNLANLLWGHLRGFNINKTEQNTGIKSVFDALSTNDEVKALYVAYGERATYDGWEFLGYKKHNMIMALRGDMDEADFNKICLPKLRKAGLL